MKKEEKQRKRVRRVDAKRTMLGRFLCRLLGDEAGQTIMEYVVLGVMVVAAAVTIVMLFGQQIRASWDKMIKSLRVDGWECTMSTTAVGTSAELIKLSLGAADITAASSKITPRRDLEQTDFSDLWWVGDKAGGGMVAVKLINTLSTGGFSLQTTKNGKGQISLTITGHVSINAQDVVPMEFYSTDA